MVQIADRSGAIQAAEMELGVQLTQTQRLCAVLLDPLREIDWSTQNGKEIRGDENVEPCSQCADGRGTFQTCVSVLEFLDLKGKRRALYAVIALGMAADLSAVSIWARQPGGIRNLICLFFNREALGPLTVAKLLKTGRP
ncbi:LOW QUALITY PROTEIN: hypothetical protein IFM46972_11459 [Aspergillus udagawae]|uniref:Uncharacterized protein n=1 Tax=Aspergillus udagawae TaxID=91492 RepID=A0A8H3SGW2_9EURO|nr:LOW QUALITY PROTEIN: hypothetical protein IFM46972_11459 [Aspergillus udagawae]